MAFIEDGDRLTVHTYPDVGHNDFYKNVDTVIRVLNELDKDTHLLKIGADFSFQQWKLIDQLGLRDRIRVLGYVFLPYYCILFRVCNCFL